MKTSNTTIAAALLMLFTAGSLAADDSSYVVDFKIGSVHIRRPMSKKWEPLKKGDVCSGPAFIRTGPRGHLVLLKKGRQFLVAKNRIVKLSEIDNAAGKSLFSVRQRIRQSLTGSLNLRRTTVSAVRGNRKSASMGLTWMDDFRKPEKKRQTSPIKNALDAYEKKDYPEAIALLKKYLPAAQDSHKAEARHLLMLSYFQDGQYSRSLTTAELLLTGTYRDSTRRTDAYFIGALAADYASQYHRTVALMEQFIRWHPRSCLVPDAKVLMGEVLLKSGQKQRAEKCFAEVLEKYPDSEAASAVRKLQLK